MTADSTVFLDRNVTLNTAMRRHKPFLLIFTICFYIMKDND
ncbi:hypothetical protein HMPREF1250_0453 [Megasphaera vaginalis (ex Srinivasan et al. 2021)]|uniref:Uncharacterized protein n=1 Tax=Megasphaera vaginalis (ex Srinivasan et al. 2021) TaxID=1111454 RepID=U7UMH8_9FIRM|nr:hypothetical protein HMPREF1250_0453 [Megasphaera vaginalis (ex Srinivasan et al. 2021)]